MKPSCLRLYILPGRSRSSTRPAVTSSRALASDTLLRSAGTLMSDALLPDEPVAWLSVSAIGLLLPSRTDRLDHIVLAGHALKVDALLVGELVQLVERHVAGVEAVVLGTLTAA